MTNRILLLLLTATCAFAAPSARAAAPTTDLPPVVCEADDDTAPLAELSEARPKRRKTKKAPKAVVERPVKAEKKAEPEAEPEPEMIAVEPINDLTLNMTAQQADSLVAAWYEQRQAIRYNEFFNHYILADSVVIEGRDSVASARRDALYEQRLRDLVSPVPLSYNYIIRNYINTYVERNAEQTGRIMGLTKHYFPLIEDELLRAGLPIELRALPIIESALQATAVSRAGAVGLWQFMPSTGKTYGLEINSLVDERRDPIRATQAACRFLKELFDIFGDWTLAIAAYNCGPGNVSKAIARSGGKTFWEIYDYLPRETRGYVPAFIGATYAFNYHRQHGISPADPPIPLAVDTIQVNRVTHFDQISSTIDVPTETLRLLNPQYRLDIIPASTRPYTLVLPQRNIAQYIEHEGEIMAKDSLYLKEFLNPANLEKKRVERTQTVYRVKSGDTLGSIARRNRVTVKQLMRWNNLKNDRIRIGQRIRIEK